MKKYIISNQNKEKYAVRMAENLPVLRKKLKMSQTELGQLIGVSRQSISSFENKTRIMPWQNFMSMLFVFCENGETRGMLPFLGIYTPELMRVFRSVSLDELSKTMEEDTEL